MQKPQFAPAVLGEYDPRWIEIFNKEKKAITDAIGEYVESIEHIGSTAILGIKAKPEIDILIGVGDIGKISPVIDLLSSIGYVYFPKFEEFVPERRYFIKSEGIVPLVHIHMVETKSDFYRDHILFRDYLRNHPEDAQRYERLKEELIEEFNGERDGYTEGKVGFIKEILVKAAKHGL